MPIEYIQVGETDSEEEGEEETEEEGEDDEETQGEEEEEETEGEESEEELLEVEEYIPVRQSPRVSGGAGEERRVGKGGGEEKCFSSGTDCGEGSQGKERNHGEIDGLFCAICMEAAWTSSGDHHVCCLPCGHIYGLSCIERWLQKNSSSRKCPQCNKKFTLKDVRKLFALQLVAMDGEVQMSASWSKKEAEWKERETQWKKREDELQIEVKQLTKRAKYLEHLLGDVQSATLGEVTANRNRDFEGHSLGSNFGSEFSSVHFVPMKELQVDGARLFDVDASSHTLLVTRRLPGLGGTSFLSRINLLPPYEREDIFLPPGTKAIRDLRISPFNSSLALYASMGKKLAVLSTQSNNVVLAYDLPAAAWSCSWDINNSHHIYAGLQNGSLLAFDMRQTAMPMESMNGLTSNVIHTICSLNNTTLPLGCGAIISASSAGLCHWSFGGARERPFLVPKTENQGVCISLAYNHSSNDIIASYRPKIYFPNEMAISQPVLTPTIGQGVQGSHVHFKRLGSNSYQKLGSDLANVNDIRLSRSTIIYIQNKTFFASGDEVTVELILQELPSFTVVQRLKSPKLPIHDVKYTDALGQGLLGCLSEDVLQLFSLKL
ncbi:hypothetical protein SLEP1_g53284 [Rubroshorea leprosula]|uniref:RING-type E3 ubiquitin transferase n=1 Tax=Rubroshorea leprosula TaxID=152421 RepID=A0AAV5MA27_9ROSI|nr:hypothetical protein SLEP1_g53284 [Rubroshorea leprosula]